MLLGPVRKALASALLTLGLFVLAEGLLATLDVPDPGLFAGDPAWQWRLRPGLERVVPFPEEESSFSVRTSVDGYRDDPLPDQGLWVAAMGCSTTFGWGVEEHQAWPALLEGALGIPVLNGGVPGYSTHQALRSMESVLEARPALVIYSYLVRDAQLGARSDAQAVATPWLGRTHLVQLLSSWLQPTGRSEGLTSGGTATGVPRVSSRDYGANLGRLVRLARGVDSEVLVLGFPMQEPPSDHLAVLGQVSAAQVVPRLPSAAFFENDPLHLTASGHRLLAQTLEAPVRALLAGEPLGPLEPEGL